VSEKKLKLPAFLVAVVDADVAGGEFFEKFGDAGGDVAVAGNDYGPFQVFAEFFGADLPFLDSQGWGFADADDGPMAHQGERINLSGARAAENEVIVAVDENAYQSDAVPPKRIFRSLIANVRNAATRIVISCRHGAQQ
jgi:hypothetical protein